MSTFKLRGYCLCHKKVNSFMVLKFLSLTVQRLRSKALSLVCLFRFSEFLPLIPIVTQSPGERDGERGGMAIALMIIGFVSGALLRPLPLVIFTANLLPDHRISHISKAKEEPPEMSDMRDSAAPAP